MPNLHTPERQPDETQQQYRERQALPPVFHRILASIEAQPAMLVRAANKASPRRFSNEPITGFASLDADATDERLELERDMHDDMQRRSA